MNNVDKYYERKELLRRMENAIQNRNLYYVGTKGKDYDEIGIVFGNGIKEEITLEDRKMIKAIIEDKIKEYESEIKEYVMEKLKENVENSRKEVRKEFFEEEKKDEIDDPRD